MPTVTQRWEIIIDGWRPAALNELLRGGPYGANRLKRHDREFVWGYSLLFGVPEATGKRRISLRITIPKGQRRKWDVDAFWKSLLDACVQTRVLLDDSERWCEQGKIEYEPKHGPLSTTIIVEDLE